MSFADRKSKLVLASKTCALTICKREGATTSEQERMKALEREVKELRKANEILRLASAFFAQAELDRRFKP